jgi:hypothetical protein
MPSDNARRGPRGDCMNCDRASDCTFPRSPDRPVTQCEEFVWDSPPSEQAAGEKDHLTGRLEGVQPRDVHG